MRYPTFTLSDGLVVHDASQLFLQAEESSAMTQDRLELVTHLRDTVPDFMTFVGAVLTGRADPENTYPGKIINPWQETVSLYCWGNDKQGLLVSRYSNGAISHYLINTDEKSRVGKSQLDSDAERYRLSVITEQGA